MIDLVLRSNSVMEEFDFVKPTLWRDKVMIRRFTICREGDRCNHSEDHTYRFDGQMFYPKGYLRRNK